jgi:hypothetical protein
MLSSTAGGYGYVETVGYSNDAPSHDASLDFKWPQATPDRNALISKWH